MNFLFKLPCTQRRHNGSRVIMDQLTKFAHFLSVKETFSLQRLAKLFIEEIVRLYGVPIFIVSE